MNFQYSEPTQNEYILTCFETTLAEIMKFKEFLKYTLNASKRVVFKKSFCFQFALNKDKKE